MLCPPCFEGHVHSCFLGYNILNLYFVLFCNGVSLQKMVFPSQTLKMRITEKVRVIYMFVSLQFTQVPMHKDWKSAQELAAVKNCYWKKHSTKIITLVNLCWTYWPCKVVYLSKKLACGFKTKDGNWSLEGGNNYHPVVSSHPYTHIIKYLQCIYTYMYLEKCTKNTYMYTYMYMCKYVASNQMSILIITGCRIA